MSGLAYTPFPIHGLDQAMGSGRAECGHDVPNCMGSERRSTPAPRRGRARVLDGARRDDVAVALETRGGEVPEAHAAASLRVV